MKTVRKLFWLNAWLIFAFVFLGGVIYGYHYLLSDWGFIDHNLSLSSLVPEMNDPSELRILFESHLGTDRQLALAHSSIVEMFVWLGILLSLCGAGAACGNMILLRRIRGIRDDEL
jgi:hypothetical protein